jgi:hypothetical protein
MHDGAPPPPWLPCQHRAGWQQLGSTGDIDHDDWYGVGLALNTALCVDFESAKVANTCPWPRVSRLKLWQNEQTYYSVHVEIMLFRCRVRSLVAISGRKMNGPRKPVFLKVGSPHVSHDPKQSKDEHPFLGTVRSAVHARACECHFLTCSPAFACVRAPCA